jgi:hypothetical protein
MASLVPQRNLLPSLVLLSSLRRSGMSACGSVQLTSSMPCVTGAMPNRLCQRCCGTWKQLTMPSVRRS